VINVFDIDHDGDTVFYSMELLSGTRLSHLLRRIDGAVLQRRFALAIIRDIGAAVAHAHARGVVHADLKPSNIMITLDGEVRVLDFGGVSMPTREPWVSEGEDDEASYQPATPAYASCEQLERRRADPRDDIYALACIAYVLLAGRHPFDHVSSIDARARGMRASRPAGVSLAQWRALRRGLAWGREKQTVPIETWLTRIGVAGAARQLPPLAALTSAIATRHPCAAPRRWLCHCWRSAPQSGRCSRNRRRSGCSRSAQP
jgi:serine/threonine protein kinase